MPEGPTLRDSECLDEKSGKIREAAERFLREYREHAEGECAARISYHEMQGDLPAAAEWRRMETAIARLRRGEKSFR